jgi:hypothetical protein|tara:strand:- start:1618 stop:1818 length:201 start_codon:yes stop_codon:yes gene_type:complete
MNVLKLPKEKLEKIILEEIQRFRLKEQSLDTDDIKAVIAQKIAAIDDPNALEEINTILDTYSRTGV